jgi:hypothetical protein
MVFRYDLSVAGLAILSIVLQLTVSRDRTPIGGNSIDG